VVKNIAQESNENVVKTKRQRKTMAACLNRHMTPRRCFVLDGMTRAIVARQVIPKWMTTVEITPGIPGHLEAGPCLSPPGSQSKRLPPPSSVSQLPNGCLGKAVLAYLFKRLPCLEISPLFHTQQRVDFVEWVFQDHLPQPAHPLWSHHESCHPDVVGAAQAFPIGSQGNC